MILDILAWTVLSIFLAAVLSGLIYACIVDEGVRFFTIIMLIAFAVIFSLARVSP